MRTALITLLALYTCLFALGGFFSVRAMVRAHRRIERLRAQIETRNRLHHPGDRA